MLRPQPCSQGAGDGGQLSGDDAQSARARFDGFMSIAAKLAPTCYSERMMVEHAGNAGGPVVVMQVNLGGSDTTDGKLIEYVDEPEGIGT